MNVENIPKEMRSVDQWVMWSAIPKKNGKIDKVPVDPISGRKVSAHDPENWIPFDQSLEHLKDIEEGDGGFGFVVTADVPLFCMDVDDAYDGKKLKPFALGILKKFRDCYVELSPSGSGLHVWGIGTWRGQRKRGETTEGDRWEIYDSKQFITVTGETLRHGGPSGSPEWARIDAKPKRVPRVQSELDDLSEDLSPSQGKARSGEYSPADVDVTPDESADVSSLEFDRALEMDATLRKTWNRKRRDLSDKSASGYCMSLTDQLVKSGWSDQEICDAIITWRKKHGEDLKLGRSDNWYARTIARARSDLHEEGRVERDEEILGDDSATHEERYDAVNRLLGAIHVEWIKRFPEEDPTYDIGVRADSGRHKGELLRVSLGGPRWFHESQGQTVFREKITDVCGVRPPLLTKTQWRQVSDNLIALVQDEEIAEGTAKGLLLSAIELYLFRNPPVKQSDDSLKLRHPVFIADSCGFHAATLWAFARRGDLPLPKKRYSALRAGKFEAKTISFRGTSTQYWVLPTVVWESLRTAIQKNPSL